MKDLPVIFSGPMVRALLNGRKTMTRRLAWLPPRIAIQVGDGPIEPIKVESQWQKVNPGDRLWVRESMALGATSQAWKYAADDKLISLDWPDHRIAGMVAWAHHQEREKVPSIHMPRWASRLTLEVMATKIERLQEITEEDAKAEGVEAISMADIRRQASWSNRGDFAQLWNKLHGASAWDANPEVVALTFSVHKQNIDSMRPGDRTPASTSEVHPEPILTSNLEE